MTDVGAATAGWAVEWEDASLRLLIDELPDLVCQFLPDGTLLYVNRSYTDFHGCTRDEMLHRCFLDFIDEPLREVVAVSLADMQLVRPDQPVRRTTHESVSADGRRRWHEWTDRAFFSPMGQLLGWLTIGRDVTDSLAIARRAEHELVHDHLTGVLNRRGLLATLDHRLALDACGLLVGYVDVDAFKSINDRRGHAAGDAALVEIAGALQDVDGDVLVGRVGGDEFIVALQASTAGAPDLAALHQRLATSDPPVTVSVGWARGRTGDTAEDVMARADAAMYRSRGDRLVR